MVSRFQRKIKRVHKKHKKIIYPAVAIILLIILFFPVKNAITGYTVANQPQRAQYEITEVDLFEIKDFSVDEVSVLGLMVGDRTMDVLEILGSPDLQNDFPPNIVNFEYSVSLGFEETGLIIHLEDDFVTKITVKEPFNKKLKGKTKAGVYEKKEVYAMFGKPDGIRSIPLKKNSPLLLKQINYDDQGLEFLFRKNMNLGFSLVL